MNRTEIEANLNVAKIRVAELETMLDATQPNHIKIGNLRVARVTISGRINIDGVQPCNDVPNDDACALRDWLNYHFPKENA